ncbi:MAG: alpha/beta fold hydrolase [Myxococcales bacterium]|nr:alpha/beta fold hydrolase [Myxococcales bacterium]
MARLGRLLRRLLRGLALLALTLALLAAIVPLLIPVRPLAGTVAARELAPDARFVEVDGLALHVEERGAGGTPLVLLHGFLASTFTWREVLGPLARDRRVVAFDRPAFGLSDRPLPDPASGEFPGGRDPYAADAQVAQTLGLMDALAIDRAILVGNSAGGTLALRIALARPDRVRALILLDPAVYRSGPPGWMRWVFRTPQLRRVGPLILRSLDGRAREFAELAWHDPARINDALLAGYIRAQRIHDWDQALWRFTVANEGSDDLPPRLADLDMPILVITGDDDRVIPTEESVRLADALPDAELVVIGACGHVPQEECPQAVLAAIDGFLARLEGDRLGSSERAP